MGNIHAAILYLIFFFCQKRNVLEESNLLDSRVSALDEDLEDMETSDEEDIMVINNYLKFDFKSTLFKLKCDWLFKILIGGLAMAVAGWLVV